MSTKDWFNLIQFDKEYKQEDVYALLQQWSSVKEQIHRGYEHKNIEVQSHMLQAISLYNKLLVEVSDTEIFDANDMKKYEVLPLNGEERYKFVVTNSSHFAAYRQLSELFEETTKKIVRLRIMFK